MGTVTGTVPELLTSHPSAFEVASKRASAVSVVIRFECCWLRSPRTAQKHNRTRLGRECAVWRRRLLNEHSLCCSVQRADTSGRGADKVLFQDLCQLMTCSGVALRHSAAHEMESLRSMLGQGWKSCELSSPWLRLGELITSQRAGPSRQSRARSSH